MLKDPKEFLRISQNPAKESLNDPNEWDHLREREDYWMMDVNCGIIGQGTCGVDVVDVAGVFGSSSHYFNAQWDQETGQSAELISTSTTSLPRDR